MNGGTRSAFHMRPSLNLLAVLNLLGAAQGLLLTLALVTVKRGNRLANKLLAGLTLSIAIIVTGAVLLTTNYVFVYPHLSRVHHPFVFLAGPLLFLYIRTITAGTARLKKKDLLHFVPSLFVLAYLLPYFFQSRDDKAKFLVAEFYQESLGQWYYIRSSIFIVQFLVYLILVVAMLVRYSKKSKAVSAPDQQNVRFKVRFFAIASIILWLGALLRLIIDPSATTNLLVPLGASIVVYAMGYLEMSKPEIASNSTSQPPAKKYEKSTLTAERQERYRNRLLQYMKDEKPFRDGELTVQKLADQLSIPSYYLSQTINERLGQTFSDFINSYRVEEAKERLLDPSFEHLSILGIAVEVGFNSKSSFNAVFKKHTDMTPSEFRKTASAGGANANLAE